MTAFLKIDRCAGCGRDFPWEWVPPIAVAGKALAGTGVWRSGLVGGLCGDCSDARAQEARHIVSRVRQHARLVSLLGGPRPEREFRLERFDGSGGNDGALERARKFDSERDNLYLFGPCGSGKTHLACAIAGRAFQAGRSAVVTTPARLVRSVRMKPPEEEQRAIDVAAGAQVLVLDGFRSGESPFARQLLEEILDARYYRDTGGLVVTARCPLVQLMRIAPDDGVVARLARMCQAVELRARVGRQGGRNG